jgi:hypothetical protein
LVDAKIREAIDFHIDGLVARREPVLAPSVEAGTVSFSGKLR